MLLLNNAMIEPQASHVRFVERIFRLRVLGLGLGFFVVGAVLFEQGSPLWMWALLAVDGFVWPHIARQWALGSADPERAEMRNLLIDSAMGGFWVALMQFNLLPSALLVIMLAIDKISVGGWRLLARALVLQATVCAFIAAANGFAFHPQTSMQTIIASLPFLMAYPLAISTATFTLSRRAHRQNRVLALQTRVDGPTGLLNRSSWEAAVDHELRRFRRGGVPASLLMIDIDRFKEINDRYGHLAGDEVIRTVADVIRHCIRDSDVPGRYGGDEFGVVLAHTGLHAAMAAAERIRQRAEETRFARAPDEQCTLSIGIASASGDMQDIHAWISQADSALYQAKLRGRNQSARI